MNGYTMNARDKTCDKVFIGYEDGSYSVEYIKPKDTLNLIQAKYRDCSVIYLYHQQRNFRKDTRVEYINKLDNRIKTLEVQAESYLDRLANGSTGRGIKLGSRLRDCRDSYLLILDLKRWQRWKSESGRSVKEYYKRRENE